MTEETKTMTKPTPLQQTLCSMLLYGLRFQSFDYHDREYKTYLLTPHALKHWGDMFGDGKPILRNLNHLDNDQLDKIGNIINGGGARREFNIDDAQSWIRGTMKTVMGLKQAIEIINYLNSIHANIYDVPEDQYVPVTKEFNPYK